jgi:hypothetical protein
LTNRTIGTDNYYAAAFNFSGIQVKPIDKEFYTANFSSAQDDVILVRKEIVDHPYLANLVALNKLGYDPNAVLGSNLSYSRVFDCETVTGYIQAGKVLIDQKQTNK